MSTTASPHAGLHAAGTAAATLGPVVLASDGGASSTAAAAAALRVARRLGVKLDVVAAVPPLQAYTSGWDIPVLPVEAEDERRRILHDSVVLALEPVLGPRGQWRLHVRNGSPPLEITEAARAHHATLIVVGTGSHRVIDRLLRGEVSLQVIRHASTPVLAVAPGAEGPFRHAVVGVDFSAASTRAALTALVLLDPPEGETATLTLVHVRPVLDDPESRLTAWTADYEARAGGMMKRLKALLEPWAPPNVHIESLMPSGTVTETLQVVADRALADLMVVGTRSAGWIDRFVVGSVANRVVRDSPVSVLVAPRPEPVERIRLELRVAGRIALSQSSDWEAAMNSFTKRNAGRPARLELGGQGLHGLAVESEGYRFRGAAYEPRHKHIDIMLGGDPEPRHHLTHGIANVRAVSIVADDELRDRSLVIEAPGGEAVLTFVD